MAEIVNLRLARKRRERQEKRPPRPQPRRLRDAESRAAEGGSGTRLAEPTWNSDRREPPHDE